jgi:hypothetical protein
VTQNFSTADAMGRLTLNLLMSFAEFEREMIAERTRDKIAGARRKGKWTGGPAPLGYDVVNRKLIVNPVEAELVRHIFDLYLAKRSAVAVAHALNAEHLPTKHQVTKEGRIRGSREWDKNSVLHILHSPVQAGLTAYRDEIYQGEHTGIIERGTWEHVQTLINGGRKALHRYGRNPNYILTGLLRCSLCGAAFTPVSSRRGTRDYRYYRCATRDGMGATACESKPLPAGAIESFVVERVREALTAGAIETEVSGTVKAGIAKLRADLQVERASLPNRIATIATEGKRLVETASSVTGTGRRLLDGKLQETGDHLGRLEQRLVAVQRKLAMLDQIELEASWVTSCLTRFDKVWDTLTPENRGRLVRAVITRVEVNEPTNEVKAHLTDLNAGIDEFLSGAVEAA